MWHEARPKAKKLQRPSSLAAHTHEQLRKMRAAYAKAVKDFWARVESAEKTKGKLKLSVDDFPMPPLYDKNWVPPKDKE